MSFNKAGLILKTFRINNKMTQLEISKKVKVHSQFVSNWERGKCLPPLPAMKKIYKQMSQDQQESFKFAVKEDLFSNYTKKIMAKL